MEVQYGFFSLKLGTMKNKACYFFTIAVFELYVLSDDGYVVDKTFSWAVGA
jgi:hypothetical protein